MSPFIRAALFVMLLVPGYAGAADVSRGQQLHDEHCIRCHASIKGGDGTRIYTREDRRIHSLEALRTQVNRCKNSLNVGWPQRHVDDVVAYLNASFYKFEE